MMASNAGGRSGRNSEGGSGGSAETAAQISVRLLPRKGVLPVSIRYRIAPSAQMSVRASTLRAERICSGDM
jgi:hypothetical protein